jgi:hypothetical protein
LSQNEENSYFGLEASFSLLLLGQQACIFGGQFTACPEVIMTILPGLAILLIQ